MAVAGAMPPAPLSVLGVDGGLLDAGEHYNRIPSQQGGSRRPLAMIGGAKVQAVTVPALLPADDDGGPKMNRVQSPHEMALTSGYRLLTHSVRQPGLSNRPENLIGDRQ